LADEIITDSPLNKKELARIPGNVRHANRCDNASGNVHEDSGLRKACFLTALEYEGKEFLAFQFQERCSRIDFPNVDDLLLAFHLFPALGELKNHTTKFTKK
jgi:hypothetical protein